MAYSLGRRTAALCHASFTFLFQYTHLEPCTLNPPNGRRTAQTLPTSSL